MIDIRAGILAITLCLLIALAADRPKPILPQNAPYCPVDVRVAGKDERGEWHYGWSKMYRPCEELDRYENI